MGGDIGLSPGWLSTINKQWDNLVHGTLGHAMTL